MAKYGLLAKALDQKVAGVKDLLSGVDVSFEKIHADYDYKDKEISFTFQLTTADGDASAVNSLLRLADTWIDGSADVLFDGDDDTTPGDGFTTDQFQIQYKNGDWNFLDI